MEFIKELFQLNEAEKSKKPLKSAAKSVYRRDYLKTKNKPYRKYDPQDHKSEESK